MKKVFALMLASVFVLFCFASCAGGEQDAYDLYINAMKNANKGMEAKMTLKLGEIETTVNVKACETAYEVAMDLQGMQSHVVYIDGVMYTSVDLGEYGTQKIKQEMSFEEFLGNENAVDAELPDLDKKALENVTVEIKDGKPGFTVILKGNEYADMLEDVVGEEIADFGDIQITCEFNSDHTIASFLMKSSITIGEETMDMEMKMEFSNIGKAPAISAPADADSYTKMPSLGDLGEGLEDLFG